MNRVIRGNNSYHFPKRQKKVLNHFQILVIMQKRIKLHQILGEKNKNYPEIWGKLLELINQSSPIFYLECFGAIAYIDKSLYLLIEEKVLNNYTQVTPMINLQQYFLRPDCYRLNFRQLSKMQRYVVEYFISYIKEIINTNHYIYLFVLDLHKLGKLVISKNMIEYFNGTHNWKYQIKRNVMRLPSLMQNSLKYPQNEEQIAKKLSLSVKKYASQSLNKQKDKKVAIKLNRPNSATKLQTSFNKNLSSEQKISLDNNRLATESFQLRAKSKSKVEFDNLKIYQRQKRHIKTQIIQNIKTQAYNKVQSQHSRSRIRKQSSQEKLNLSKFKTTLIKTEVNQPKHKLQIKQQKRKLTLTDKAKPIRIPGERQKIIFSNHHQTQYEEMILQFVCRSSENFIKSTQLKDVYQPKIKQYLVEIASIYRQKQSQIRKNREQNKNVLAEQARLLKNFSKTLQIDMNKLEQLLIMKEQDYKALNQYYDFVEECKQTHKQQISSYIVNYEQHFQIVQQTIIKFNKNIIISKLSRKALIHVALVIHDLFHYIKDAQINLLNRIIAQSNKLISIDILKQTSFKDHAMDFIHKFQCIFTPLIKYLQNNFTKILWIQQHEFEEINTAKSNLHGFIINYTSQVESNFLRFRTANCKSILNASYHTQKQGLGLIKKLDLLKMNLQSQIQFKSQLYFHGIYFNLSSIKEQYLALMNQKYYDIYSYFYKVYEKSESQLNNKLKTIIVINVDYLSDYKCREYREEIEQHYKNLLDSLMLIINHFYYLLKESQINRFLSVAYDFKAQIHHNLLNFTNKLQEYRNNSNKTIKMLEIKNKENKEIYQELTHKLKKLLINLNNERAILEFKAEIIKLDNEFQTYNTNNKKLIQSMKENQMVYWQDDQFFITNITLLKSSLDFLQGKNYKIFFNISIGELTINEFYNAFQDITRFMNRLAETKIQKLFKPTYTLIQNNLVLAQVLLYKQYTEFELQKSKEIGLDIYAERSSKIYTTIKRYQNFDKKKFEKILDLYRQSRLNQFNLYHDESYNCLKLQKVKGAYDLEYISNLSEIKRFLQDHNTIKASLLISTLQKLQTLSNEILLFNKMIYLISESTLPEHLKQSILQEYNQQYEKLLSLSITALKIQKFRNKLSDEKVKYMQIYYHEKVNTFTRYALCSIEQLIQLDEWQNNQQIARNIRYIYESVDDVIFDSEGNILTYIISKDSLMFDKPFNIFEIDGEIAKIIYIHTENFLRNSISHSQYACIYIKLLIWHIYFTQQVELCFMTESSLTKVKDNFLQLIGEIANQIRYDIKLHHKSYEIAQLNFFINHIQKIKNIHYISDFQWVSTIRYYQKLKIVKVEQNQRVHDYSFEIKKPMNYDPSFQLETNISYGFKQSEIYYEMSALILGKPFVTFHNLSNYGFQANYSVIMNFIKKYGYFVRIMVKAQNFKSINYFHKKILQLSLKKLGSNQQQTLNMPVFFQYKSQAVLPLCFPEKYRNFSNPEFSYDLNLIILLQLNKYQQIIANSKINIQILIKVLNLINIKKNLTMKKAVNFVESLSKFLEEKPQNQEIYKFCYKYFIVNYQVDDHELSLILNELTKQPENALADVAKQMKAVISEFRDKNKNELIIYGPSSHKSTFIKEMKIPSYHSEQNSQIYYIEGVEEYLAYKKLNNKSANIKFIIEDRYIHHIEPSLILDAILLYTNQLSASNVELVFKSKVIQLKIQGNYNRLWNKFYSYYEIFVQISHQKVSLIGMAELTLRCFSCHINEFLNDLEAEEKQNYKLNINKETIRTFFVVMNQIFYYLLPPDDRKKFTEKIKNLPFMEQYRCEEIHSMTCKGLSCEKLLNLIKKEKVTFRTIGNYIKEFILIKKYLRYGQPVVISSTSKITSKLLKQQIQSLEYNKIDINLHDKYIDILRISKYQNILYIVNDLHLQDKPKQTFLKVRQELSSSKKSYYLMISENNSYRKAMKTCVGFKFPDLEMQQVYKYQNKQGLADQIQFKCKNIWNNNYFESEATFLMFLINISVKLPSQYFKKYFARQMSFTKLNPSVLAIEAIEENEEMIKKVADISSTNAILIDYRGHHQEITETQINKRMQKIMSDFTFVQKIVAKDYYKDLIPYALADKLYVIKEEIIIFPIIITTLHERKYFKLQNIDFIAQFIEVIEQIYLNQRQCTLIVEQPLTSSSQWAQFMSNYLKGIDLINLYSQLREYTELLASKEEYVYRLQNQSIPIKDKVNSIIYSKVKIIISQTVKSNAIINSGDLYINNIVYLNCSLTNQHKIGIADKIIKKILSESSEDSNQIFFYFKQFILKLIQTNLLFINRLQQFISDVIITIKLQLEDINKFKEGMLQKKKLFYNLSRIREGIDRQFEEISIKEKENKIFLNQMLAVSKNYQKIQATYVQLHYYEDLIKIRDQFLCNQEKKYIWIKEKFEFQTIYREMKDKIFENCLKIEYNVPILELTPDCFERILKDKNVLLALKKIWSEYASLETLNQFILLRYVKYILSLHQVYPAIQYPQGMIQHEVKQINYYFLLDLCVELKARQNAILKQFDDLVHRKKLIDNFIQILTSLEHLDLDESQLFNYHIFNRIRKIIRNYSIEADDYPLMKILLDYDAKFLTSSKKFEEHLLKQSECSFDNSNKSILKEKRKLIVYDPHNRIEALCDELSIKIIYVNSQHDIRQLYDYKFKMTIFCIKLETLDDYYKNRKLITNCREIIQKKHTDLKQNILEKLVISIDQREILSQIKQEFSVINLGYNFIKFTQQLEKRIFDDQYKWNRKKQQYLQNKKKLRKEIQLIKTLNPQEISLYINKLQTILRNFQDNHKIVNEISCINAFNQKNYVTLELIFKLMIRLHKRMEFPLNLSLRLLKNIKIEELMMKCEVNVSLTVKEQQDCLKNILLSNRSDNIYEQIDTCINQSRYIAIIYEQFNKKIIKEVLQIEDSKKYVVRTIIEINDEELKQFVYSSSLAKDETETKEIVLFFVKFHQICKLKKIINKCSVLWI